MKRGVIGSPAFIIIFAVLIIAVILIFGFYLVNKSKETAEKTQMFNVYSSIKNAIKEMEELEEGSNRKLTFNLPAKVKKICFLGENYNKLNYVDFNDYYQGAGVYFIPEEYYELDGFELEKSPLCLDVNGKFNVNIEKKENVIVSFDKVSLDCENVYYNKENNIDVVFVNHNFKNDEEFIKVANEYVQVFFSIEPFIQNKELFNFHLTREKVECSEDIYLFCDNKEIKTRISKCPNDYAVVLSKHFLPGIRSSATDNIMVLNTGDNKLVLLHEFGHVFAKLADEYILEGVNKVDAVNCKGDCEWDECFEGCTLSSYYRSSEDSLMNSYGFNSLNEYNEVSKNEINKKLGVYK